MTNRLTHHIDWVKTIIPFVGVLALFFVFLLFPYSSQTALERIRHYIGDDCGLYFAVLGLCVFLLSVWTAFSKYGKIRLGNTDKPQYNSFIWGAMIFTSALAADIVFYSLCEWSLYASNEYVETLGEAELWIPTMPLFHWGPIAWCFHIVLAICFGFMMHVRQRNRQCFSEACRPLLGTYLDRGWGRLIDIVSFIAMLAGIATTFSLATPLLSSSICRLFGIDSNIYLTVSILIVVAVIYTSAVLFGMKGISRLAKWCTYSFAALLLYVLLLGGETRFILETGFQSIGNLIQHFFGLATYMDPLRENSFPQNWTLFYWAYWIAWTIGTPFFIALISKGRTIKETILGGYGWALAGTFSSFIILGNYGVAQQLKHGVDIIGFIDQGGSYSDAILQIIQTLPAPQLVLIVLVITMVLFYSTSFDTLSLIASSYSYKSLSASEVPDKRIRVLWALVFILLPIGLLFSDSSMYGLQSVSIIAAFPVGIIIILIIISFFKDARLYLNEKKI